MMVLVVVLLYFFSLLLLQLLPGVRAACGVMSPAATLQHNTSTRQQALQQ
jgi:hypothetical protein